MRSELSLAALLLPMMLCAQENVKVKGRIVNRQGEAVEYVQVGVPKRQTCTITTSDGRCLYRSIDGTHTCENTP